MANGLKTIESKSECEIAARYLSLNATRAYKINLPLAPNGCSYTKNENVLLWNKNLANAKCGSWDCSCICKVSGMQKIFIHPILKARLINKICIVSIEFYHF